MPGSETENTELTEVFQNWISRQIQSHASVFACASATTAATLSP
jgi:hypothetical protein